MILKFLFALMVTWVMVQAQEEAVQAAMQAQLEVPRLRFKTTIEATVETTDIVITVTTDSIAPDRFHRTKITESRTHDDT